MTDYSSNQALTSFVQTHRLMNSNGTIRFTALVSMTTAQRKLRNTLMDIMIRFDGEIAHSETYLRAFHSVPADYPPWTVFSIPGGGNILIGGRYVDRFERRDGIWRIAHRTGLLDWRQDIKAEDGGLGRTPSVWRGRFGASDPSEPVVLPWL